MQDLSKSVAEPQMNDTMINSFVSQDVIPTSLNHVEETDAKAIEFCCSGEILATAQKGVHGTIRLWQSSNYGMEQIGDIDTMLQITMMRASPRSEMLAVCDTHSGLTLYSVKSRKRVRKLYHSAKHINCIAFSNMGSFASASEDSSIKVWSTRSLGDQFTQFTSSRIPTCISFPNADEFMATGHKEGKVKVWDLRTRQVQQELSTSSSCQVTSIVCASLANTHIYACTKDAKLSKLDQRMPNEPVRVYEDERFSYASKSARLSLSTH